MDLTVLGLVSGSVGAMVGALVQHGITSAKPSIHIRDVLIDPMQSDDEKGIAREVYQNKASKFFIVPEIVYKTAADVIYIKKPERYYQHPQFYSFWLYTVLRDITKVRLIHKQMPNIVREMRKALHSTSFFDYLSIWADYDIVFSPHLIKAFLDGALDLKGPELEDLDPRQAKHLFIIDEDGDFIIKPRHGKSIVLAWSRVKTVSNQIRPFFSRLAAAFAIEDLDTLSKTQKYIDTIKWNDPILNTMENIARDEIIKLSRVVIRGVIANAGRTPISLSGSGHLVVHSSGFSYHVGDPPSSHIVQDDISLPVELVDEGYIQRVPSIEVPPGGVRPFTAVSSLYLFEMEKPLQSILLALHGSERLCQLHFRRLDNGKITSSRKVPFRHDENK